MTNRLSVQLRNFNTEEGKCACGCGKITAPELMLRLQAFISISNPFTSALSAVNHWRCPL